MAVIYALRRHEYPERFRSQQGGANPRAAVLWRAGAASLIDDVRFLGVMAVARILTTMTIRRIRSAQALGRAVSESLDYAGGGGTFADIWTPDTFAQAGFYVSDTKTPGHVYELSNEHQFATRSGSIHVENWDVNAPQSEERRRESRILISGTRLVEEHHHRELSRLSRDAFPRTISARFVLSFRGHHFRNVYVNAESGLAICDANGCGTFCASANSYENSIEDMTHHLRRANGCSRYSTCPRRRRTDCRRRFRVLAPARRSGNWKTVLFISGAGDASGKLYLWIHEQRIYGWYRRRSHH